MVNANLAGALIVIMSINLIMLLTQYAIIDIDNQNGQQFQGCGAIFYSFGNNNNLNQSTEFDASTLSSSLPGAASTINPTSGYGIVDWIASASNWINGKIAMFTEIAAGPYCIIHSIPGVPSNFVTLIALFWYGITLFLIIAFIFGR